MTVPHPMIDTLLRRAAAARDAGDGAQEVRLLDEAVATDPADPRARNARGMRALADGDAPLAIQHFRAAAAADPGEPALRINLASACRAAGDTEGERVSLQSALDLDPRSLLAQLRMAESLHGEGLLSRAAPHWSAAVQLGQAITPQTPGVRAAVDRAQAALAEHQAAFGRALDAEITGDGTADPATHRFRACVDHMNGHRRIYQNQCEGIFFPFLPAMEFFDRALFPWLPALERHSAAIAAEARALIANPGEALRPYVRQVAGTPENKWTPLDRSFEWSACFLWEYGEANAAVCDRCPATVAALREAPQSHIPGKAPTAFFSILRAGAHIPAHTGVTNTRTIVHLPLIVPPACGFRVGGETRDWREGEAFAFDDTIEHEAWNRSDQDRVVLIFDVWNPYLTPIEQEHLVKLFTVADRGIVAPRA